MIGCNPQRGDVSMIVRARPYRLRLTLQALAELEKALAAANLAQLAQRLQALSARDLVIVLGVLARAGGEALPEDAFEDGGVDLSEAAAAMAAAFGQALAPVEAKARHE